MKFLLIILLVILSVSCNNDTENVSKEPTNAIIEGHDVEIFNIYSCEYIYFWKGSYDGGPAFSHKGNCKNH
jgi:hypothetical protein